MMLVIVTLLMVQLRDFSKVVLVLLTAPLGIIGVTLFLLVFQPAVRLRRIARRDRAGRASSCATRWLLVDQIDQDLAAGRTPRRDRRRTVRRFAAHMV